jgi:hypothetical protein
VRAQESTENDLTLEALSQAVTAAGLEIYRAERTEIRIAERVRMHLMDSGVAVLLAPAPRVCVTIRAQRSDFPMESASDLLARVRCAVQAEAAERGYAEANAESRNIENPADPEDVLDVWHELTYAKGVADVTALIAEVRWALAMPKCIDPQ